MLEHMLRDWRLHLGFRGLKIPPYPPYVTKVRIFLLLREPSRVWTFQKASNGKSVYCEKRNSLEDQFHFRLCITVLLSMSPVTLEHCSSGISV